MFSARAQINALSSTLGWKRAIFNLSRLSGIIFIAYRLQTQKEEDEVSPQDGAQLKEVELRDRTDSGIVNPGMETRKKCV